MNHSATEQQASDAFAGASAARGHHVDRLSDVGATPAPGAAAGWRVIAGHPVVLVLALALVNFGAGRLAILLATPPGYATAIFPLPVSHSAPCWCWVRACGRACISTPQHGTKLHSASKFRTMPCVRRPCAPRRPRVRP